MSTPQEPVDLRHVTQEEHFGKIIPEIEIQNRNGRGILYDHMFPFIKDGDIEDPWFVELYIHKSADDDAPWILTFDEQRLNRGSLPPIIVNPEIYYAYWTIYSALLSAIGQLTIDLYPTKSVEIEGVEPFARFALTLPGQVLVKEILLTDFPPGYLDIKESWE